MGRLGRRCLDCGSVAVASVVEEVKQRFRMEIVSFACGAELRCVHSANGNIGRATHSGCPIEGEL